MHRLGALLIAVVVAAAMTPTVAASNSTVYGWSCCCDPNNGPNWLAVTNLTAMSCTTALVALLETKRDAITCKAGSTWHDIMITAVDGVLGVSQYVTSRGCMNANYTCTMTRSAAKLVTAPNWAGNFDRALHNDPIDAAAQAALTENLACALLAAFG
jgi:hypothetical protein